MKSHSCRLFSELEQSYTRAVAVAVATIGEPPVLVRCHELVRAVCKLPLPNGLDAQVQDGTFGLVDHSWLYLFIEGRRWGSVLDVYSVGRLPMVQLVDIGPTTMHHALYHSGPDRKDIDEERVVILHSDLRQVWGW